MNEERWKEKEIKALESIAQQIALLRADLRELLEGFEEDEKTEEKRDEKRKQKTEEEEKGFRGDAKTLENYIKDVCPNLAEALKEIDERKTAFYVSIDYVGKDKFRKIAQEVERKLDGKYSKSGHCFIIPKEG